MTARRRFVRSRDLSERVSVSDAGGRVEVDSWWPWRLAKTLLGRGLSSPGRWRPPAPPAWAWPARASDGGEPWGSTAVQVVVSGDESADGDGPPGVDPRSRGRGAERLGFVISTSALLDRASNARVKVAPSGDSVEYVTPAGSGVGGVVSPRTRPRLHAPLLGPPSAGVSSGRSVVAGRGSRLGGHHLAGPDRPLQLVAGPRRRVGWRVLRGGRTRR